MKQANILPIQSWTFVAVKGAQELQQDWIKLWRNCLLPNHAGVEAFSVAVVEADAQTRLFPERSTQTSPQPTTAFNMLSL